MSAPRNEMELKEEAVRAHYAAAAEMLMGIDHAPRLATAKLTVMAAEKSPEVAGMQRRFRSTTPGLVTRSMARSEGVRLIDRIALADDDDPLTSPLQAATAHALRRALAISLAMGEVFSRQTGLVELKKANLENRLPGARGRVHRIAGRRGAGGAVGFRQCHGVPAGGTCRGRDGGYRRGRRGVDR